MGDSRDDNAFSGISDIIKGVGKLVGSAINIADKDTFKKTFSGDLFKGKNVDAIKGKYDFSVKLGLNKEDGMGFSSHQTQYTPQAEVFNEKDQLVVIVELPGVDKESLQLAVEDNILVIKAEGKEASYQKNVNLGDFSVSRDGIIISENNGIFKLTLKTDCEENKGV